MYSQAQPRQTHARVPTPNFGIVIVIAVLLAFMFTAEAYSSPLPTYSTDAFTYTLDNGIIEQREEISFAPSFATTMTAAPTEPEEQIERALGVEKSDDTVYADGYSSLTSENGLARSEGCQTALPGHAPTGPGSALLFLLAGLALRAASAGSNRR